MKTISKHVRSLLAVMTSMAIGCCVLQAQWLDHCSYYDDTIASFCTLSANGSVCGGSCGYVTFPPGTARCGFCAPAWSFYCANAAAATMTTVNTFTGNCGWTQVQQGSPYSVTWECLCPLTYPYAGTTTVGCWCW